MAAILVYAGIKGYKKHQLKRTNSSAENQAKSKKNQKSISSLVIPSVTSAHIFPAGEETTVDSQLQEDEGKASVEPPKYTAQYSPDSIGAPKRAVPPPPIMLGLTLCESPSSPPSGLYGDSPIDYLSPHRSELQGGSPIDCSGVVFELVGDEPLSPAPLHVVKRNSSPLPPELTYSSDESEEDYEEIHHVSERSSYLEVPKSAELLDFEPPPIPPKSPARKFRLVSS